MERAVLYLRVSTLDQTTANQERELRQVGSCACWRGTDIQFGAVVGRRRWCRWAECNRPVVVRQRRF